MSGERMTSRAEARRMKALFDETQARLEGEGFTPGQIGHAMLGFAAGMIKVHDGGAALDRAIGTLRVIAEGRGDAAQ